MSYLITPQIVNKARLTLDYLSSTGGAMPEEVFDQFLVVTIKRSDFLQSTTTRKMKSTTYRIPTMEFGSRALHKRTRGQALTDAKRTTPTTAGPTITAYDYAAEITLEREDLESGVSGNRMLGVIMNALTKRVGTDAADIVINSATASSDDDLTNFNGFHTAVSTNTAAAGSTRLSRVNCKTLFKTLPDPAQDETLTIRTNKRALIDYTDSIGDRPTALGDEAIRRWIDYWGTVKIKGDQVVPRNLGGGNDTLAVISNEKNYNVGFHREIENDSDKDVRAGTIIVVFTVRMGGQWAVEKHAAKLTGVLAS